jgi:hypothetical protein
LRLKFFIDKGGTHTTASTVTFIFLVWFSDSVSLCSPGWPQTCSPPASAPECPCRMSFSYLTFTLAPFHLSGVLLRFWVTLNSSKKRSQEASWVRWNPWTFVSLKEGGTELSFLFHNRPHPSSSWLPVSLCAWWASGKFTRRLHARLHALG